VSSKIVHILRVDKFIPAFLETVELNFNQDNHKMVFLSKKKFDYGLKDNSNYIWINKKSHFLKLSSLLYKSDKIILHSVFFGRFMMILLLSQPWLLKKCYWVMWGGDFYFPEKITWIRKQIIKRIRHFVTYLKGDFDLVKRWYKAKGEMHDCFMYPSNLFKELPKLEEVNNSAINIMIGNSADPINNHIEILEKVSKFRDKNISIYAPLSYGDAAYARIVIQKGKEVFGEKFTPLTEFMDTNQYIRFLNNIDIAIFAHKRQQAMGNTISLLGMGKKVYMRNDITPWNLFSDIGVKVFNFNDICLDLIDSKIMNRNIKIIKSYFSKENYLNQLVKIFD